MTITQRRLAAVVVVCLLLFAGGAVAQTYLFTAGSGVTINATNGPAVTLGEDLGLAGSNPTATNDDAVIVQETQVAGPPGSSATVTNPSSTAPTLSSIDTGGGQVIAATDGIQNTGVSDGITEITYSDVDLTSSTTEFEVSGTGTLEVQGFNGDQWVRVNRKNDEDELVQADTTGVITVDIDSGADLTFVEPAGGPTLSNPSPTGGDTFSTPPVELSVDVSDGDFDTTNEEVTLEWYVDGELDGTTTATSGGTATFEASTQAGGTHEWYVVATDRTGNTVQSGSSTDPHTFALPSELRIYNETNPDELVTGTETNPVTIEIRFYQDGEDEVIERSTTDGTVSLQGLPTDEEFVVTADAEGYEFRRIIVDSLIEQQDVFLLPDEVPSARVIFELDDSTGQFDGVSTRLYVERALNQSGTTSYRVIAGDRFGSSAEFPVALQDGTRYRLRVENDQGQTRTLGAYTVSGDARAVLPIGRVSIETNIEQGVALGARLDREDGQNIARVDYWDPEGETDTLDIEIVRLPNETVVVTDSISTPGERHLGTYQLPAGDPANASYEVRYEAHRNGQTLNGTRRIGSVEAIADDLGVPADILSALGYLAILAFTGLVAVVRPALSLIVAVVTATLLTIVGVVAIPTSALGVSGVTALLINLARARGP